MVIDMLYACVNDESQFVRVEETSAFLPDGVLLCLIL